MQQPERGSRTPGADFAAAVLVALAGTVLAGALGANAAAADENGKAVFVQLCQGCHTIGGGKKVGPDLQGLADRRTREWVSQFVLVPDKVIASGDPIAKQLVSEYGMAMPNLGVSEAQIGPLLEFLGFTAAPPTPTATTPNATTPTTTTPAPPANGDSGRGKSLFTGSTRLDAGGPACLSCHSVAGVGALGGGQLGPDLTGAFAKYGGAQGLASALKTVSFPTMAPIFSRKPLTDAERADLVAFLQGAPDKQRPAGAVRDLVAFSAAALFLIAALGMGIWRSRLNGVRKPLVNRARGR